MVRAWTGTYDKTRERNWLGHREGDSTDDYTTSVELYYKIAPYDWFHRILRRPGLGGGKIGENHLSWKKSIHA